MGELGKGAVALRDICTVVQLQLDTTDYHRVMMCSHIGYPQHLFRKCQEYRTMNNYETLQPRNIYFFVQPYFSHSGKLYIIVVLRR